MNGRSADLIACSTNLRPFVATASPRGRVAVKVINHLGDEVMKVLGVDP